MIALTEVERRRLHGGWQVVYEHASTTLDCTMRIAVFLPPQAESRACPTLVYLSGLTCTEQNVITKSGAQRWCAEHGLILVCPDTSPRGDAVADAEGWDLGKGAGFYLSATQAPWSSHYRMDAYVTDEVLPIAQRFTDHPKVGITGHSMGGHGALTLGLTHAHRFASISAFAPILEPSHVPWGTKAFTAYLGADRQAWAAYDATELVAGAASSRPILIDQGAADPFLAEQLTSDRFRAACAKAGQPLTYRLQPDHDHSYYFVASFIEDHVRHHAAALKVEL